MLYLSTTLPSPVDEPPASGAAYAIVESSMRWWRLRPGEAKNATAGSLRNRRGERHGESSYGRRLLR